MSKATLMRVTQRELDHMKKRAEELGGVGHHGLWERQLTDSWLDTPIYTPKCLGGFLAEAKGMTPSQIDGTGELMNERGFSWMAFDFTLAGVPGRVSWERIEQIVDFVIIPEQFTPDPRD